MAAAVRYSFKLIPDRWRVSAGLALILAGQSIGWAVRGQIDADSKNPVYPIAVVLLGFAMLLQPRMIASFRLHCPPILLATFLLLVVAPMIALCLVAPLELIVFLPYLVFVGGVLLIVAATPATMFNRLPETVMLIAGISSLLPFVQLAVAGAEGFVRLALTGNENTLITGSVGGIAVLAATIVGLGRGRNSAALGAASGGFFLVGMGAVLLSNTRSVMAVLLFLVPLQIFFLSRLAAPGDGRAGPRQRLGFWMVIGAGILGAPAVAVALLGPELFGDVLLTSWSRIRGALALLDTTGAIQVDESTAVRTVMAAESWEKMSLVGHGIMAMPFAYGSLAMYQHNSYLQAFYDLGMLGGGLFLFLALLLPAALILLRLRAGPISATDSFIILMFAYVQGDQLAHATPYNWQPLLAIGLVYVLTARMPWTARVRPRGGGLLPIGGEITP